METKFTALPADNACAELSSFTDSFPRRHLGPSERDVAQMLEELGYDSLDQFSDALVPDDIRIDRAMDIPEARGEHELLKSLRVTAEKNRVYRSCIGMGYTGTVTPPVILRNVLENPGWYTQYTPYQAEIAQGRLEALLNFQTMIADLTGLPLAGASLLDEATAAAEAMTMCVSIARDKKRGFWASDDCHPQTLELLQTRADGLGIDLKIAPLDEIVEDKGVRILIDPKAILFLIGTEMDWEQDTFTSGFKFNNPNAVDACGCGESFTITPAVQS